MAEVDEKPIFRDLSADDPEPEVTQIESLCVKCFANGYTRLLLTRIPHYKNVVIMSFTCEQCGYENNEIQSGGAYAEHGVRWKLHVECKLDLDRQVVKSDFTSVKIPELDLEIPPQSQKGEVTTVEGILERIIAGLSQDQNVRRVQHPEAAHQIDEFIDKIRARKDVEINGPFTLELEDIGGNCFIENPEAPRKDPRCTKTIFTRTKEQDHLLGIFTHEEVAEEKPESTNILPSSASKASQMTYESLASDEVLTFPTNCPHCNAPAETNMKLTNIPHFKEVVIMATLCDKCGYRTNEVKSGGGIEEKGVRFELKVNGIEDFSRDILKSDTCSMEIPELDLEVGGAALGGRFSTTEGLLRETATQIREAQIGGDAPTLAGDNVDKFLDTLTEVLEGKRKVTIILDDPTGNSYVQSLHENPDLPDEGLKITHYERSHEQNEELGLNDIKTEGYEQDTT